MSTRVGCIESNDYFKDRVAAVEKGVSGSACALAAIRLEFARASSEGARSYVESPSIVRLSPRTRKPGGPHAALEDDPGRRRGRGCLVKLFGPGSLSVVNVNGANGEPIPIGQPAFIRSITVGGASPASTRLVGSVRPSGQGDGRVYFSSLSETASTIPASNIGIGMLAVDIPNFWLGATAPITTGTTAVQGSIDIPDGIVTLRFGGIDTSALLAQVLLRKPPQ